jgi:hypothetical protein
MTRSAFRRQGPFVGSGGPYSPGPATASPLLAMGPPLDDVLTPPWASADRRPFPAVTDAPSTPSRRRAPRDSRPGTRAALGPRSLGSLSLFGARCRAYLRPDARLPTSATALRRAGTNRSSLPSQGRRPRPPSFSFSCHAAFLAEAVTRGEPRYVRPIKPRCRFLPLSRVCPTAIPDRRATPERLAPTGVQ